MLSFVWSLCMCEANNMRNKVYCSASQFLILLSLPQSSGAAAGEERLRKAEGSTSLAGAGWMLLEDDKGWGGSTDSEEEHGIHWHADIWICPGAAGHYGGHGGYPAAQLEGQRRCGLQHHHGHLPDAGAVDGLHLVQHRHVQLHAQVLGALSSCVLADCTHHHGALLHAGRHGPLPCFSGAEMHTVGRRTPFQATRRHRQRRLLRHRWLSLPGARFLVYQGGHHKLLGLQRAGEQ